MTIDEGLNKLVAIADQLNESDRTESSKPPTHNWKKISSKWARITSFSFQKESVWAFVALQNYSNKTLGEVKLGDIHRAASWSTPAKNARGSVFDSDIEKCLTKYGPVYLK